MTFAVQHETLPSAIKISGLSLSMAYHVCSLFTPKLLNGDTLTTLAYAASGS